MGKEMLSGAELKRNTGGRTQLVKTCATEQKRVDVLRNIFGLVLTEGGENGDNGERGCIADVVTFHSSNRANAHSIENRPC